MKHNNLEIFFIIIGAMIVGFLILTHGGGYYDVAETSGRPVVKDVESGENARVAQGEEVVLGIGESASPLDLPLKLLDVTGDYRCPVDVECIEGGAISVQLEAYIDNVRKEIYYSSDSAPIVVGGYKISITNISPLLYQGQTIEKSKYEVTFKVESAFAAIVDNPSATVGEKCIAYGGEYDSVHNECLGIGDGECSLIDGKWNECASACRHDAEAEVCTMQCVLVCEL